MVLRADSAFYGRDVIAAARRARRPVLHHRPQGPRPCTAAIAAIPEDAWTTIRYPHAVFDEQLQQWVSDAEVAEVPFTAFASRGKKHAGHRAVDRAPGPRRRTPTTFIANAQGELFPVWRHHAVFTDSPLPMLARRGRSPPPRDHRTGHRRPEERPAGAPALRAVHRQLAPGWCWPRWRSTCTRAAGALASPFHAKATTATIRRQLINVAARVARSARRIHPAPTHQLALGRPPGSDLFTAAIGPPRSQPDHRPPPQGPTGDHVETPGRPAVATHP